MTPRRTSAAAGLVLAGFSLAALPCQAGDTPIATASAEGSAASDKQEAVVQIPEQRARYPEAPLPPEPDRAPHGMIGVSVGTGGYRHAAGIVTAPLGKTGEITVAAERIEGPVRWR